MQFTDITLSKLAEYANKRLKRSMEPGKGVRRLTPTFFEIHAVEVCIVCTCVCMHVCVCVYVYVYVCVCCGKEREMSAFVGFYYNFTCAHTRTHKHTHTYTHIHAHTYIHTYINTHTDSTAGAHSNSVLR